MATTGSLSPLRKLYDSLNNKIGVEEFKSLKTLVGDKIGRRQLEQLTTPAELFVELENCGIISESDLKFLKSLFDHMKRPNLVEMVVDCEETLQSKESKSMKPNPITHVSFETSSRETEATKRASDFHQSDGTGTEAEFAETVSAEMYISQLVVDEKKETLPKQQPRSTESDRKISPEAKGPTTSHAKDHEGFEAHVSSRNFTEHKSEGPSGALFVTSWKKHSYDQEKWKLIMDFCENTLKMRSSELSKVYCTVLDDELSAEQKEAAERFGVTLIPATKQTWCDSHADQPTMYWLLCHQVYYPCFRNLEKNVHHVIPVSTNTKEAAATIHRKLFKDAQLHQPPDQPAAVLFINDAWSDNELGLTGFHRTIIQDFCERKAKAGETLKAYSTVLDVDISDEQKKDALSCGVTLIPAQRKEGIGPKDDPSRLEWLLSHEIHYPDLGDLENVHYIVGYAPKTGQAAADIRKKHFRGAKLVLINHARPEPNCLQAEEYGLSEFEEKMLQMASEADILFSIGPHIYGFFHNAYGAEVQGRDLSDIPHEELLPRPNKCFWVKEPKERKVTQHHILTCGQMDTQEAIERCKPIAASVGAVAKRCSKPPEWKIVGVSKQAGKSEQISLEKASKTQLIHPQLQPEQSRKSLLTSLQQSHLCLPAPCYWDYSFYGLEAMVFGLPTSVHNDSHLAHVVEEHLKMHVDCCVVGRGTGKLTGKISQHLKETSEAFKKAKALKTAMIKSEDFTKSFAKFASLLKGPANTDSCKDLEEMVHAKPAMKQVPGSTSEKSPTQFETVNESIQSQATRETCGELMEAESGQETTSQSEGKENEKPSNCNDEQQDCLVKVVLDKEVLQKHIREDKKQDSAQAHSVQLTGRQQQEMERNEVKAAMVECEHGLKRRVQAVLADKDSSNEVKDICEEKVGLKPKTLASGSLGILLKILTLYYLYRVKQTCRSRSLAKALEPLLITDEMREIAAKVGIKLQLKAVYDTATFEKIECFFINRDGGGIHDDDDDNGDGGGGGDNDDAMQQTDDHLSLGEEPQIEQQAAVGCQAVEPCKTNLEQSNEQSKLLLFALDPALRITSSTDTSVKTMFKAEKCIRLKGRQCDMLQVLTTNTDTVQHILSCRQDVLVLLGVTRYLLTDAPTQDMDTQDFEDQLIKEGTQVLPVKIVDERVSSLVRSLLLFQTSDIQVTQYLVEYLLALGQTVTKSKIDVEKIILECQLNEAKKEKAALEKQIGDLSKRSDSKEIEFIRKTSKMNYELLKKEKIIGELRGRLAKLEDPHLTPSHLHQTGEGFEHQYTASKGETEASALHQPDETEITKTEYSRTMETEHEQHGHPTHSHTDMPTLRKRQLEADQKKESLPEKKPRSTDSGIKTSHGAEGSITSVTKDKTGQWSRRIINGHQGHKFKDVRGLAFHNDKLLVCDSDNNIVHILNKDYTCEKELGSFSGQFAKPFQPQSIAVSQDNLYFILDDSNVQIVVCNQNNKVIRIITLPTNSNPWCIALVKGFVIVTEVNGHRVLKYSQTGQYIAECLVGHQDDRQTPSKRPYFVAVNSKDVIMVSDCRNHCIKCFDAQFNFLYQYGHRGQSDSQLSYPHSIAVDGADHVYVCEWGNDRISIWSEDRTCIDHLFHRQVIDPWYMAVTADGDRIAVSNGYSNEIYVFSKKTETPR